MDLPEENDNEAAAEEAEEQSYLVDNPSLDLEATANMYHLHSEPQHLHLSPPLHLHLLLHLLLHQHHHQSLHLLLHQHLHLPRIPRILHPPGTRAWPSSTACSS